MKRASRADYFRRRRREEEYKIFTAEIHREKMERFEEVLQLIGKTKVQWLNEKIGEEIRR